MGWNVQCSYCIVCHSIEYSWKFLCVWCLNVYVYVWHLVNITGGGMIQYRHSICSRLTPYCLLVHVLKLLMQWRSQICQKFQLLKRSKFLELYLFIIIFIHSVPIRYVCLLANNNNWFWLKSAIADNKSCTTYYVNINSKLSCSLSNWVTVGNNNSFAMIQIQIIKFVVFYAFHVYLSRWYQLTTSMVFHVFDVVSHHKNCRLWPWHVNYYYWIMWFC